MSLQIRVVQSATDENKLVDFLLERDSLLALPHLFESGKFDPLRLGQQVAAQQMIFRQSDVEISSRLGTPGCGRRRA